MKKRILAALLAGVTAFSLAACSSGGSGGQAEDNGDAEETEIQVFIAASLNTVMTELAEMYHEEHPEVKITYTGSVSSTMARRRASSSPSAGWASPASSSRAGQNRDRARAVPSRAAG